MVIESVTMGSSFANRSVNQPLPSTKSNTNNRINRSVPPRSPNQQVSPERESENPKKDPVVGLDEQTEDRIHTTRLNRDLRLEVLREEGVVQAQIVDTQTDEVLRKIPRDETLLLRQKIEAFVGLFFDEVR